MSKYADIIDAIRRELTNEVSPDIMVKFEVAVARALAYQIIKKRKSNQSGSTHGSIPSPNP